MSRGFLDASLRSIAQAADTSTGSIYTRFGDKEGLFRAIAEPVVDEFKDMFRKVQEDFHQFPEEEQRADMGQYTARHQEELLDYIYDHFDVFRLLLDGAHGGHRLRERQIRSGDGGVHPYHRHRLLQRHVRGGAAQHGPRRRPPLCQDAQPLPHGGIFHRVRSSSLTRGCAFWYSPLICAKVSNY